MNNQKMLDVVTMIANIILPDECDHGSALEIWLRAMKRKAREALESHESEAVGNAAAMREALEALIAYWDWNGFDAMRESKLKDMARAALSAPARQCDVGTAAEQERRYKATGEVYHTLTVTNTLAWAQMQYAAEEGAGT